MTILMRNGWKALALVAVLGACLGPPVVSADPVRTTELYDPNSTVAARPRQTGVYSFFKAEQSFKLSEVVYSGEYLGALFPPSTGYFFSQLFETTETWETPNGNGDRLFYAQIDFPSSSPGANELIVPLDIKLKANTYYRLSFQPANVVWSQTYYQNENSTEAFDSPDGRVSIFGSAFYGAGGLPIGAALVPITLETPAFSLRTDPVPEPSTVVLFAAGLIILGVAYLRRRRSRYTA